MREADVLREVIREAHGAVRDLRAAIRDAEEARRTVTAAAHAAVEEKLGAAIQEGLESFKTALTDAIAKTDEAIMARFDALANTLLHGNAQGRGPNIVEEARAAREGRQS